MELEDSIIIKALKELDYKLHDLGVNPFDLKVVGGFALLIQDIRPCNENTQYTDIDYVGREFPAEIKEIIDEIGLRYRLGRGWVNRDVMMYDLNEDEIDCASGSLHFEKYLELSVITVYKLRKEDLLRMKVISVDNAYVTWYDNGGDFTRWKDFEDIKLLMDDLGWDTNKLIDETEYYILDTSVYKLIRSYIKSPNAKMIDDLL